MFGVKPIDGQCKAKRPSPLNFRAGSKSRCPRPTPAWANRSAWAWGFQQGFGACSWDGIEATRGQLEKDRGEKRPWLLVGAIDVERETRPPFDAPVCRSYEYIQ